MNQAQRNASPVTVFGAGIAGLTAAHELAVRGFKVQVIDPDINEELFPRTLHERRARREAWMTLDRGIGGMARSQYAFAPDGTLKSNGKPIPGLWSGHDILVDQAIAFHARADDVAVPKDPGRAKALLDQFEKVTRRLIAEKYLPGAIKIRIPAPRDHDGNAIETLPSAAAKREFLRCELAARGMSNDFDDVVQMWSHPLPTDSVYFAQLGTFFAAEHGFRFFPSFYRHLFDTMRRTPILNPRDSERTKHTVFDNLVPVEGLGFARAGRASSFMVPRHAIPSFEALRKILMDVLGELEYSLEDIARFQLKLFKYMTSSSLRRERELENMSWGDFLQSDRYSPVSREHIEYGPQMSAALRGSQSDARTQGNITVQLLLDQLKPDALADYTLAGPTNGTWFDHWHDFLEDQGVTFARGELTGWEERNGELWPVVEGAQPTGQYFVVALSLPALRKIAPRLVTVAHQAGIDAAEPLERAVAFAGDLESDLRKACPDGPLQHLSGIQYYFDEEVRFWRGHTQYLDSPWGLTSIAQPQFWSRVRREGHGYRSILSVDIGIFDREFEGKRAWDCDPDTLAALAWKQIEDHHDDAFRHKYGPEATFPRPIAYALDATLVFDTSTEIEIENRSPFLVNRTGQYRTRPGRLQPLDGISKCVSAYEVIGKRFVFAGTFMQTYTRLTSMEAANESARHAVNALLQHWKVGGDRCDIWDPEDHELEDLQWLKDLDEALVRKKLPHLVDILDWTELPPTIDVDRLRAMVPTISRRFR